jgi:hypothetical protein
MHNSVQKPVVGLRYIPHRQVCAPVRLYVCAAIVFAWLCRSAPAQTQGAIPGPQPQPDSVALLADASGPYAFDHNNESIEIDIHHGRLKGYIARLGDAETDKGTPLTYFFDRTSIRGDRLSFATRVVHGVWYSFDGTILRGDAKEREDEGYYVLTGKLQVHHPRDSGKSSSEIVEQRTVHYKSLAQ